MSCGFATCLGFRIEPLSVYRHRVASAQFFANAVLNVSPYSDRESAILVVDRRSKVVESCRSYDSVAIDVRDARSFKNRYLLLYFRYTIASGARIVDLALQAQ